MDFKAIEEMVKTMDNSKLGYLEVNWHGISIVMRKQGEPDFAKQHVESTSTALVEEEKSVIEANVEDKKLDEKVKGEIEVVKEDRNDEASVKEDENIKEVLSPIVGTFYRSSSPDKPVFVEVGSKVKKGDALCIVEAMKLMNEIQSEVDGEVVEILVNNNEMVEYGQPMFKIKVK
ncbi:acetyl-CoA carboxylase biotin carboxyl carrier protein [Clostridium sp. P21]|uniref:Biotin carboxyl carrier protein of acetyl-CoA carboxylase n=1 Tax=Clostridium muellerianum TaxID=2716538 RepID=A0A7Y0HNX4_9CLOT|nr:acetyl-CoA carboxylase biotin carboxyl carrier protein [Clostridium muellerianum]NMM62103.1 acetyl-CoA carboxylase biotin carboxyl carrier protein [Clostridium muellerianum]